MFNWFFLRSGSRAVANATLGPEKASTAEEVVSLARSVAIARRQEYVGTHDVLLALSRLADRPAGRALGVVGATEEQLRLAMIEELSPGLGQVAENSLPCTPTARRVLETAHALAQAYGEACADPELLLLALLAEPESIAQSVLIKIGVDLAHLSDLIRGNSET